MKLFSIDGEWAYAECMAQTHIETSLIDWSKCPLVEANPRKVSGVPIVKGTRVQADSIVENYSDGSSFEEIADNFDVPESTVRELVAYAVRQRSSLSA